MNNECSLLIDFLTDVDDSLILRCKAFLNSLSVREKELVGLLMTWEYNRGCGLSERKLLEIIQKEQTLKDIRYCLEYDCAIAVHMGDESKEQREVLHLFDKLDADKSDSLMVLLTYSLERAIRLRNNTKTRSYN
jgi:hypothetical protein